LFYFEVNILDKGDNGEIGIGFCAKTVNLNRMPGWENNSWGYHGDDGNFYCCSGTGKSYGPLFTTCDTIGCCLNFRYKVAFYTKNGVHLGIAFQDLEGELYPCVGMRSRGGSMKVNFGHEKFKYTGKFIIICFSYNFNINMLSFILYKQRLMMMILVISY
ncbi:concanavalin A-like lectin/glucanase domain-containing protein, partial [Gigaspora rosea]